FRESARRRRPAGCGALFSRSSVGDQLADPLSPALIDRIRGRVARAHRSGPRTSQRGTQTLLLLSGISVRVSSFSRLCTDLLSRTWLPDNVSLTQISPAMWTTVRLYDVLLLLVVLQSSEAAALHSVGGILNSIVRKPGLPDVLFPSVCPPACSQLFHADEAVFNNSASDRCSCVCPSAAPVYLNTAGYCVDRLGESGYCFVRPDVFHAHRSSNA
ncbi:hypothetical protein ANCCAN_13281, partial [Ancylostoma caninum]